MKTTWERKTTKYQKSFLFPQLISGDPRLQEKTQVWPSISKSESPDGLIIPLENFSDELSQTEVSSVASINPLATLLLRDDSERFRIRWDALEFRFVDDPRAVIREADGLVAEIVEKITRMSVNQVPALEAQLNQMNGISTDDLHHAMQHYRSFFSQLLG